jgi:2-oxoglutarate dehydrogenase E1 component
VKNNKTDVAVIRLEQLCPFPFKQVMREMNKFSQAEVVWCQEEHKNMGPYNFVHPRFVNMLKSRNGKMQKELPYNGRNISASTATGYPKIHAKELNSLLESAMK